MLYRLSGITKVFLKCAECVLSQWILERGNKNFQKRKKIGLICQRTKWHRGSVPGIWRTLVIRWFDVSWALTWTAFLILVILSFSFFALKLHLFFDHRMHVYNAFWLPLSSTLCYVLFTRFLAAWAWESRAWKWGGLKPHATVNCMLGVRCLFSEG